MIELIIVCIIVGAVLYLLQYANFLDPFLKKIIYVIIIVCLLIYILRHLALIGL
jgi:hypothetical protein